MSSSGAFGRTNKSAGGADVQHFFPPWPGTRSGSLQRAVHHQPSHLVHNVIEIKFSNAIALEIRRCVEKVNRVRNAMLDLKLDRVHLVAEGLIDSLRVFD